MEILCAKFIRDDESEFYVPLNNSPAPIGGSGRMIVAGMYYNYNGDTVIFDGSYWLRNDDPRIVR